MTASEPQPAAPYPKLRWYQFRLQVRLLVLTIIAVAFYLLAFNRQKLGQCCIAVAAAAIACIVHAGYFAFSLSKH